MKNKSLIIFCLLTMSYFVNAKTNNISVNGTKAIFSAYKDVGINADWNLLIISTAVTGTQQPITDVLGNDHATVTWAFASGECGNEGWAGMNADALAQANIPLFEKTNTKYIISTGGAAGVFTCSSDVGMDKFVKRYMSPNLIGFDFDIEGGFSQDNAHDLVKQLVRVQKQYPNLRISFTLATLAAADGSHGGLNSLGDMVVKEAQAQGLDFYVNLMVMDYGTGPSTCVLNDQQTCDMGKSTIQAVDNLKYTYHIKPNRIEVTPMIGDNDDAAEVFSLQDADTVMDYIKTSGIAGVHFWSFDRDRSCGGENAIHVGLKADSTCNTASKNPLDFYHKFSPLNH